MSRLAMAATTLMVGLLVATGLIWDSESFGKNVISELAGILVGVLLASLVVERLVARDRRRRWSVVKDSLMASILRLMEDFSYEAYGYFVSLPSGIRPNMHGEIKFEPFGGIGDFERFIRDQASNLGDQSSPNFPQILIQRSMAGSRIETTVNGITVIKVPNEHALAVLEEERHSAFFDLTSTKGMFDATEDVFRRLQDHFIPRALQLEDEAVLAERLMAVEDAWRSWRQSVMLVDDDWGYPGEYAWNDFANVVSALASLDGYAQAQGSAASNGSAPG